MRRAAVASISIILVLISSFVSFADDTGVDGFNGLFFRPNVDGQGISSVDTARVLTPGVAHVGGYFQYARRTISFSDPALAGLTTDLAENQVLMNLVLGVGILDFLDVGMDIPIALMQNGTKCLNAGCTNLTNYTGSALGDIRFVIKLRLMDEANYPFSLALASDVGIPTGNRRLFTGGKNAYYEQRLIASRRFKHVEVAANVGYRVVDKVEALGMDYDDSLTYGAGVKGFLPHKLYAFATVSGFKILSEGGSASSPVEFMGGIGRDFARHVSCNIGGGARLVDGITAADFRVMGSCGIDFGLTRKARAALDPDAYPYRPPVEWIISLRTNQYKLMSEQREILDDVIRWLVADRSRKASITGNADDRASYDHNMKLATQRAMAARDYLFARGIGPDQIVLVTNGEAVPVEAGKDQKDRAANRSIVITEIKKNGNSI
ncbi:MAG: OmpA family protein [Patescibacteria group bacterium]